MLEWLGHRHFQECREMVTALHSNDNLAMQQVHAFFRGPVVSMAFGRNLGPQIARDRNQTVRLDRSAPIFNAQRKGERYYERAVTKNFARVRTHTNMLLHEDSMHLAVSIACSAHQSDLICSMHTCTILAFFHSNISSNGSGFLLYLSFCLSPSALCCSVHDTVLQGLLYYMALGWP
jgi:hypothetical protein